MKIRACCLKEKDLFEKQGYTYIVTKVTEDKIFYASVTETNDKRYRANNHSYMGRKSQEFVIHKGGLVSGKSKVRVVQVSPDGNDLATFSSVDAAAEFVGVAKSRIYCVINGHRVYAGGYRWRRA